MSIQYSLYAGGWFSNMREEEGLLLEQGGSFQKELVVQVLHMRGYDIIKGSG